MEGAVKMGASLPVKTAVSERAASVKTSELKGDFTKLLQEKRDLAENSGQTDTKRDETLKADESKVERPLQKDNKDLKTQKEETEPSDPARQEALQQAALLQMAAQIAVAVPEIQEETVNPETGAMQAVAVEGAVLANQAGESILTGEAQPKVEEKEAALPFEAVTGEKKGEETAESKPLTEQTVQVQTHRISEEIRNTEPGIKSREDQETFARGDARRTQEVSGQETASQAAAQPAGDFKMTAVRTEMSDLSHKVSQLPLKTTPESLPQDLGKTLAAKLSLDNRTLTVELEPASLGKLTIRLVYEGQRAAVSIMASNPKTLELLSQRASEIADILKEKTGQETLIYTEHPEKGSQQYDENRGNQSQGSREDREENRHHQEKEVNSLESFAQQLRLGLI